MSIHPNAGMRIRLPWPASGGDIIAALPLTFADSPERKWLGCPAVDPEAPEADYIRHEYSVGKGPHQCIIQAGYEWTLWVPRTPTWFNSDVAVESGEHAVVLFPLMLDDTYAEISMWVMADGYTNNKALKEDTATAAAFDAMLAGVFKKLHEPGKKPAVLDHTYDKCLLSAKRGRWLGFGDLNEPSDCIHD